MHIKFDLPKKVAWDQKQLGESVVVRPALCHPASGDGRSDGLVDVLQPREIALDAGLCQPHDVRATLVRIPAASKNVRIMGSTMECGQRGKVRHCPAITF